MDSYSSLERIKNIDLYFTVTTGRSGTAFLAKYLSNLKGIYSVHEPFPPFHPLMRLALTNPEVASKFWTEKKLPAIVNAGEQKYIETSHLVCKGFLEPLFELGIYPNLILLKRDKREVAKSIFFLNTIPGRTKAGLEYYLKPDDVGVLLPISDWQVLTDYQLCYWYTLEIEARQSHYTKIVVSRGSKVIDVDFNKLLGGELFKDLTDFLGVDSLKLNIKLMLMFQALFKVNSRTRGKIKKSLTHSVDFDKEENELNKFMQLRL